MARKIPEVVRAAAGLAATVLDEARKLPETLPGLPVRILGLAMQQAMKVQQQYAGLVARGDELFTGIRGENEPGLATFDEDDEPAPSSGFRDSAFDRAGDAFPAADTLTDAEVTDAEVAALPEDPAADAVVAVVEVLAEQVEAGQQSIEELVEEAPGTDEILDEIAIDELVDQAPTLEETAPTTAVVVPEDVVPEVVVPEDAVPEDAVTEDADALETALLESADSPAATDSVLDAEPTADVATTVDVLTPVGEVATVEASVTDEGIAAPETDAGDTAAPTDEPAGDSEPSGSPAVGAAPVDGYDSFTVAQLRGRLRGYALSTVQDLIAYEEATRARDPYLKMLRNRLEKLQAQAVESSPLAPRGA